MNYKILFENLNYMEYNFKNIILNKVFILDTRIYTIIYAYTIDTLLLNDKNAQKVWSKTWCTKNLSVFYF